MASRLTFHFLVLVLIVYKFDRCDAHLCLISPPQRGSMAGINKKGATDCILLKPPCGGRPQEKNGIELRQGQNFTVTFQKNLDHWTKASPGYFSIAFGTENSVKELARINDKGEPPLTLYSTMVTMPTMHRRSNKMSEEQNILQVTYVTKNPKAPPVFYQCSDVKLVPGR